MVLPFPAQGHVIPLMELSRKLVEHGLEIDFVNTEFNHRRLLRSRGAGALDGVPGFRFAAIPDGLPSSDADATQDVPALCNSTMTTCLPHLLALLAKLNDQGSGVPPVTCLVVDGVMSFGYNAAKEIGVPCAALWTASACGFMGYRHYPQLIESGFVPFKGITILLLLAPTRSYLRACIIACCNKCGFFACMQSINDPSKQEENLTCKADIKFYIGTCNLSLWPCI